MVKDVLYSTAGQFTVDIDVNYVAIAGLAGDFVLRNGVYRYFSPKDHIVIESIALVMPCCFCTVNIAAIGPLEIKLYWQDDVGANYPISELSGNDGYMGIFCENEEIPLDIRIQYPNFSGLGVKMKLIGTITQGAVCMANVPEDLDEVQFQVHLYAKLRHNFATIL